MRHIVAILTQNHPQGTVRILSVTTVRDGLVAVYELSYMSGESLYTDSRMVFLTPHQNSYRVHVDIFAQTSAHRA